MTATLSFASAVLAALGPQDKAQFAHRLAPATKLTTELTLSGSNHEAEMILEYSWETTVTRVTGPDKEVEIKPTKMRMSFMGSSMDEADLTPATFLLDGNGLPKNGNFAGREAMFVVGLALGYVPDGELEQGSKFDASWKGQGASLKLQGHFVGMADHEGRRLPKLQIRTTFTPDGQEDGTISYEAVYDPDMGVIVQADGTASVDKQPFTVKLVTKKA
jgi:hypothetical protein